MDTLRDDLTLTDAIDLAWKAVYAAKAFIVALELTGVQKYTEQMNAAEAKYNEALEELWRVTHL